MPNVLVTSTHILVDVDKVANALVSTIYVMADVSYDAAAWITTVHSIVDAAAGEDARVDGVYLVVDAVKADVIYEYLDATVTGSGILVASLTKYPGLSAAITSSGSVTTALNKKARFTAAITASGSMTAEYEAKVYLVASILSTGVVEAELGKKTQVTADITGSAEVDAELDKYILIIDTLTFVGGTEVYSNIRVGNTLLLKSYVGIETELNVESDLSVTLTQIVTHTDVYNRSAGNYGGHPYHEWDFNQSVSVKRTLAVKEASSVLEFEQTLSDYRLAQNTLIFEQEAEVYIYFIPCDASNVLFLTQEALPNIDLNTDCEDELVFEQEADPDLVREYNVYSDLFFRQHIFGFNLTGDRYTLLQAPFDLIETSLVLPNPLWDDSENLVSNMTLKKSMNDITYTYVKSNQNRLIRYTFRLGRKKALELQEFIRAYNSDFIKMQNWKGEVWRVQLTLNPLDFTQNVRYAPENDGTDINLEFEGVKISG